MNRTQRRRMEKGSQKGSWPLPGTFTPVHEAPDIPPDMNSVEAASENDRLWFLAHPKAKRRLRDFVPGEMPIWIGESAPNPQKVLVEQICPGVRSRKVVTPIRTDRPESSFILTEDGEVLSMEYGLGFSMPFAGAFN